MHQAGDAATESVTTARVKTKLASDLGVQAATDITVHTSGSVVSLDGSVGSGEQKASAEKAAASIEGVSRVINRLHVEHK